MFGSVVKHLNCNLCLRIASTRPEQLCWVGALALCGGSDLGGTPTVSLFTGIYWKILSGKEIWTIWKGLTLEGMCLTQALVVIPHLRLSCGCSIKFLFAGLVHVERMRTGHCMWCSHPAVRSLFDLQRLFIHVSVRNKICFALLPCCASTQTRNCSEKNWAGLIITTLRVCKQICGELFH